MNTGTDDKDLWQQIVSYEALQQAWFKVYENRGSQGGDGISAKAFKQDTFANLTQLRADLLSGNYRSSAFRKISIPKKKPGYRILTIPSIRDRILHTSISNALTPIFEPLFEDCSFAYRPNRGVIHAVRRIEQWRNKGYNYVVEADIVSYFDNIEHDLLYNKVEAVIGRMNGALPLLALLKIILEDQAKALGTPQKGVVQGSPLSPLLANMNLDALDEEIERQGVKMVRFADDFVILCKSERKASKVLEHCIRVLDDHGLKLHEDGTRIVNFDKGFDFIGYLFVKSLAIKEQATPTNPLPAKIKSEVTDEGIIAIDNTRSQYDPGKRVLYLLDSSHSLKIRNRSFSVVKDNEIELIAIPYKRVGRIEIGPNIDFNRSVIDLAIEAQIEISIINFLGQTKAVLNTKKSQMAGLQMAQAKCVMDSAPRLEFAKKIVASRIWNQRIQLMRSARGKDAPSLPIVLKKMQKNLNRTELANSPEELMGLEGFSSALYWPELGKMAPTLDIQHFKRTRPAKDALNASINYLTGILERDIKAAIQATSLNTGFAFLHGTRDRHDGLVFDLMEPFRSPLTEGLAIYLFNSRRLKLEMFSKTETNEIILSPEGREAIIQGYESAVSKRVNKPDKSGKLSWRPMMRFQAYSLANAIRKNAPNLFFPYRMEA